jgi:uncharacterized membrane protein
VALPLEPSPAHLLRTLRLVAATSLGLLLALCVAWELWLAPLRPGGSLMALKALPLAVPLRGVLQGRRYTYQWSCMLILAYFGLAEVLEERALDGRGRVSSCTITQAHRSSSTSVYDLEVSASSARDGYVYRLDCPQAGPGHH